MGARAVPAEGKHLFAVDFVAGPHAQLAQDAAVGLEQHIGVAGIDRAHGVERLVMQVGHARLCGLLLQLAAAAFFAAGAKVVALDKQHLQQVQAVRFQLRRVAAHPLPGGGGGGAGGHGAAIGMHGTHPARCAGRDFGVPAQVGHGVPGTLRGGQDGVAGLQRHRLAVEVKHRRGAVAGFAHGRVSVCRWAPGSLRPVARRATDSSASRSNSGSNSAVPVRSA